MAARGARPACLSLALLLATLAAASADAPHIEAYVSQRNNEAYLREGPGYNYPVLWVYHHRGYPFAVTASFDIWRRVMAPDGTVGWISAGMLSDRRTVLVTGQGRVPVHGNPDGGKVIGLADPGAIANLKTCTAMACRIAGGAVDGWIDRSRIWGVGSDEVFH